MITKVGANQMQSEFIDVPAGWPHAHLKPRSQREAERLIAVPPDRVVFVFGSNLAGHHAGGAARTAIERFGAVMGKPVGLHGLSYALPTMTADFQPLTPEAIEPYVQQFFAVAGINDVVVPFVFYVTAIGTGIAGLTHEQMAPLFADAPRNCLLPPVWLDLLSSTSTPKEN